MPDWISSLSNIVVAVAAAVAAWQGVKGLSTWRLEMIGRRRAELAEGVLSDFYQAADTISAVRSPMSHPDVESKERPRAEDEPEDQGHQLDAYYVPIARLERHYEFMADLMSKRYRMRAYFGRDADDAFDKLNKTVNEIQAAAGMMMRTYRRGDADKVNRALWAKWEGIIWEGWKEPDGIKERLDEAVKLVEKICGPILEERK